MRCRSTQGSHALLEAVNSQQRWLSKSPETRMSDSATAGGVGADVGQGGALRSTSTRTRDRADKYGRHASVSRSAGAFDCGSGRAVVQATWVASELGDTHGNNFKADEDELLPPVDRGVRRCWTISAIVGMLEHDGDECSASSAAHRRWTQTWGRSLGGVLCGMSGRWRAPGT